jgi:hypothetical protein
MLKIDTFALFCLLAPIVILSGCGDNGSAPSLAAEISKSASGAGHAVAIGAAEGASGPGVFEKTLEIEAELVAFSLFGEEVTEDDKSIVIWHHKAICVGDERCSGRNGVAVKYSLKANLIDPASVTAEPAADSGAWALTFRCTPSRPAGCVESYGAAKPCKERACSEGDAATETAAVEASRLIAARGAQAIECKDARACARMEDGFRRLLNLAAKRTHLNDADDIDGAMARIAVAADGARFVEDPQEGISVAYGAGNMIGVADRAEYRADEIRLDPDGRLHIGLRLCVEDAPALCAGEKPWLKKISHVDLAGVDPARIAVFDYERTKIDGVVTEYEGAEVIAHCRDERGGAFDVATCVTNEGANISGIDIVIPCKDEIACKKAASDLGGLASFASTPAYQSWRQAREAEAGAAAEIKGWSQAENAIDRIATRFPGASFIAALVGHDNDLSLYPVAAELREERFLVIRHELCPVDDPCDSAAPAPFFDVSIDLERVDRSVRENELVAAEGSAQLQIACEGDQDCILASDGERVSVWGAWSIACADTKSCGDAARDVRGLIAFLRSPTSERKQRKKADRSLSALAAALNNSAVGAQYTVAQSGETGRATFRLHEAGAAGDTLVITLAECLHGEEITCEIEADWSALIQRAALADFDPALIYLHENDRHGTVLAPEEKFFGASPDDEPIGRYVSVSCREAAACVSQNGLAGVESALFIPCGEEAACQTMIARIKNYLAGRAPGKFAGDEKNGGAAKIAESDSLDRLSRAIDGAQALVPASGNGVVRLLRGGGVQAPDPGRLVVSRSACLALQRDDAARGNECSVETLFRDYDLTLNLGGLSAGSVRILGGAGRAADRGLFIEAQCRRGSVCASLNRPTQPLHRALEFDTVVNSLGDRLDAPSIRLPCGDKGACKDAADALRRLIDQAPSSARGDKKRKKPKGKGGDLVGVWALQVAGTTNWVMEFRGDGSYTFTNDQTSVDGTYEAANGAWSQKATNFPSEDGGTYRLIDENTLELNGKFGLSVWRRRSG